MIEDDDNKDISNNNCVFKNQRIHTLARKYLDKNSEVFQLLHLTQRKIIFFTLNLSDIMRFLVGLISLKIR